MEKQSIQERANEYFRSRFDGEDGIADLVERAQSSDSIVEQKAIDTINEQPLSVGVVKHYVILLGTGGPADRITGELNEHGEPETVRYQFQDWFEPWTDAELSSDEEEKLLAFARHFYFAE